MWSSNLYTWNSYTRKQNRIVQKRNQWNFSKRYRNRDRCWSTDSSSCSTFLWIFVFIRTKSFLSYFFLAFISIEYHYWMWKTKRRENKKQIEQFVCSQVKFNVMSSFMHFWYSKSFINIWTFEHFKVEMVNKARRMKLGKRPYRKWNDRDLDSLRKEIEDK